MNNSKEAGFTLIELALLMLIIAGMVAGVLPAVQK